MASVPQIEKIGLMTIRDEKRKTRIPSADERPDLYDYYDSPAEPSTGGIKCPKSVLELVARLKEERAKQK